MGLGSGSTSADSAWDPSQPRGGGSSGTSNSGGGGGARNWVVGGRRDGVKKYWRPWPGVPWVRPARCCHRRLSLGDMTVIIVCAAAIQANTPLIHTIQADTDNTHNTVIYIQYRHIHAMANQHKTIFLTWWPEHLAIFPSQEILLAHLEQNTY